MKYKVGDYVTRNSYNNDTIFLIIKIDNDIAYLKGIDVRLYADSELSDLCIVDNIKVDDKYADRVIDSFEMDRSEYFYLPGKILHIDGDNDYLNRCMDFYKKANVLAIGKSLDEDKIASSIESLLKKYNPDIVIITGHDAYFKKSNDYKNSDNFINAVKKARNYEKSHDKLVIIAGACQSNYEELIKAGANFASSPKRINIHALDPAIIASTIALTKRNTEINLVSLLDKTKYGKDGMGGLLCNGLMFVGYPR